MRSMQSCTTDFGIGTEKRKTMATSNALTDSFGSLSVLQAGQRNASSRSLSLSSVNPHATRFGGILHQSSQSGNIPLSLVRRPSSSSTPQASSDPAFSEHVHKDYNERHRLMRLMMNKNTTLLCGFAQKKTLKCPPSKCPPAAVSSDATSLSPSLNAVGYQGGKSGKRWKERWLVLRSHELAFYKDDREYELKELIQVENIDSIGIHPCIKKRQNILILSLVGGSKCLLYFENLEASQATVTSVKTTSSSKISGPYPAMEDASSSKSLGSPFKEAPGDASTAARSNPNFKIVSEWFSTIQSLLKLTS